MKRNPLIIAVLLAFLTVFVAGSAVLADSNCSKDCKNKSECSKNCSPTDCKGKAQCADSCKAVCNNKTDCSARAECAKKMPGACNPEACKQAHSKATPDK
ncbi:conserved exported hypothetical protein [Candidatus Zixiibacteriota bacterium]|nr:conserved exported hypothetical protein [candidate division Zixibacteria bacterium]